MSRLRERITKLFEYEDDYTPSSKYVVLYGDYGNSPADDPRKAILTWFQKEKTNRSDVAIIAYKKEDAKALIQYAFNNKDQIKDWHAKYNCPYDLKYILDSIDKHSTDDYQYFHEGMSGDQVDPFSFG